MDSKPPRFYPLNGPARHKQPLAWPADQLVETDVPTGVRPRDYYIEHSSKTQPPKIGHSAFVPIAMVAHLMRHKKDSALGVKFVANKTPPDAITAMEGAMHQFVTPIARAWIHGDYRYQGHHGVLPFEPTNKGHQRARQVILSALIQPDFENDDIMVALARMETHAVYGRVLPETFTIPSAAAKQNRKFRENYDTQLRKHLICHLMPSHAIPGTQSAGVRHLTPDRAMSWLEHQLRCAMPISGAVEHVAILLNPRYTLSLGVIFFAVAHSVNNELSILEEFLPQGYIYTFDPPSIFANRLGAPLLNRVFFSALAQISEFNALSGMRVFAFNDYAEPSALDMARAALRRQTHIQVMAKSRLLPAPSYHYAAPKRAEGAALILHNNSDAFGQNIETEGPSSSMDGALGVASSLAASLLRNRSDLLDDVRKIRWQTNK